MNISTALQPSQSKMCTSPHTLIDGAHDRLRVIPEKLFDPLHLISLVRLFENSTIHIFPILLNPSCDPERTELLIVCMIVLPFERKKSETPFASIALTLKWVA